MPMEVNRPLARPESKTQNRQNINIKCDTFTFTFQIPYYQIDSEHCEVNVKGKWKDENEWVDIGFLRKVSASKETHFHLRSHQTSE